MHQNVFVKNICYFFTTCLLALTTLERHFFTNRISISSGSQPFPLYQDRHAIRRWQVWAGGVHQLSSTCMRKHGSVLRLIPQLNFSWKGWHKHTVNWETWSFLKWLCTSDYPRRKQIRMRLLASPRWGKSNTFRAGITLPPAMLPLKRRYL